MVDGEALRTDGTRVSAVPNGLTYSVGGEGTRLPVKRTPSIEAPLDLPGARVGGLRCYCSELFIESGGYCNICRERHVIESYGLVRGYCRTFTREGSEEGPELFGIMFV